MWTCSAISKFRRVRRHGDDVVVALPGCGAAIFDGVTSSSSLSLDTKSSGRQAALAAANALTEHWAINRACGSDELVDAIQSAVRKTVLASGCAKNGATTGAIVQELEETFRLVIVGDTSVRVNGGEIYGQPMKVDEISIGARVKLWEELAAQAGITDANELTVRRIMSAGLSDSIARGVIDRRVQAVVLDHAINNSPNDIDSDLIVSFLNMGLRSQSQFANVPTHPLGYPVFDGSAKFPSAMVVELDRVEVETIEIFSDGYQRPPDGTTFEDWEDGFHAIEMADPYRTGEFAAVKGTTSDFWFDDRSIALWSRD